MKIIKNILSCIKEACSSYQKLRSTITDVSLGDLMFPREDAMSGLQFIVAARALDVERYYAGDKSFYYQTALSSADNPSYNAQHGREIFEGIIRSFEAKGYDKNPPPILVNKKIELIDGTHRIAMCLQQKTYEVRVQVTPTRANIIYPDQIYSKQISSTDLTAIREYYPLLCRRILADGCGLCCKVEGEETFVNDFVSDLRGFADILHVADFKEEGDGTASALVMFSLSNPAFVLHGKKIISERVIEIEKLLRGRYADKNLKMQFSKNSTEGKAMYDMSR